MSSFIIEDGMTNGIAFSILQHLSFETYGYLKIRIVV